jgi:hypothetical protein
MKHAVVLRWSHEEEATAANLYEQGVRADDIADVVNRLFHKGRTAIAVGRRMHRIGMVWASGVSDDSVELYRLRQKQSWGRRGGLARVETLAAADRTQPWHPAHDPKPDWLTHRYAKGRHA